MFLICLSFVSHFLHSTLSPLAPSHPPFPLSPPSDHPPTSLPLPSHPLTPSLTLSHSPLTPLPPPFHSSPTSLPLLSHPLPPIPTSNRYSPLGAFLSANLTLPPSQSFGSIATCCNIKVDSGAPHVRFIMPVRTPGVYGEGEIIIILMRFNRPVLVLGSPYLVLTTGVGRLGNATYIRDFQSFEILFQLTDTDLIFKYIVDKDDNIASLTYASSSAIHLNNSQILRKATYPDQSADLTLREITDFTPRNGILDRQWLFRTPQKVEILIRDLYHTNPHSLTITAEHSGRNAKIFTKPYPLKGKTFGHSYPNSRLKNNYTALNPDTGIGYNYFFSDTLSENLGLR